MICKLKRQLLQNQRPLSFTGSFHLALHIKVPTRKSDYILPEPLFCKKKKKESR